MSLPITGPITDLMQYSSARFQCTCGREHSTNINEILVGQHALKKLPDLLLRQTKRDGQPLQAGKDDILLVADENTFAVGGSEVIAVIDRLNIKTSRVIFPGRPALVPDEQAVFNVLDALTPHTGLLIAIGSGTLNDLTRYVSFKTQIPYYIVATAPSMDGYASTVAPLIHNNLKITFEAWGASAIIAEPAMLGTCPSVMLAAGLGDILGKYSALGDWKISALINQEYYCQDIADLVLGIVKTSLGNTTALAARDETAVQQSMEALLLTGIAMSYVGNSRPASGSEHHLSHYWEMAFQRLGRPAVLHGSKVGLGVIITCALYHHLANLQPDFAAARQKLQNYSFAAWEMAIREAYQESAEEVINLEKNCRKNDPQKIMDRLEVIENNWLKICQIIRDTIPQPDLIRQSLQTVGGAVTPGELGIEPELVDAAIRYARELRNRYTILQLYADLGLTQVAVEVARDLFR